MYERVSDMTNSDKKRVVVGMSGGVDSSVAAYLLKEQGYEVIGVTMQIWQKEFDVSASSSCCGISAIEDASKVAKNLGIEYHVVNFHNEFENTVIKNFIDEYAAGRTPNPCVLCNRCIKWESLIKKADELGADYVATGHYARIEKLENGRYSIKNSITADKDQTYALYNLTQEQLKRTLMPVGEFTKDEVRKMAEKIGLDVANKPDSMDICFVPDNDYSGYIKKNSDIKVEEGSFVDVNGNIIGKHKGIIHYTIGQRKGLNLAMGHPVFVKEIRVDTNEVVIGENSDIMKKIVLADRINYMAESEIDENKEYIAKIRYNHKGSKCRLKIEEDKLICIFDDYVRAVTPGQALVVYLDEYVALGGTILRDLD